MVSWFSSLWQYIRKHRVAIVTAGIVLVAVIALIIVGYWFDWTGFNGYTQVTTAHTISGPSAGTVVRTEVSQPGKALWDWLQLLIIPVVLAVGALLFNLATTRTEQKIAAKRYKQDRKIALDKQREDLLQIYLDRMSELLLKENLRSSTVDAEVRNVARVRTITILFQLNARRIGYVFAFLREAGLMSNKPNEESIVSFRSADLSKINLSKANLTGADLSGAHLSKADLSKANLFEANLTGAKLGVADLHYADLSKANLSKANLFGANLREASLLEANLTGAFLGHANLSEANLSEADLSKAYLTGVIGITIEELEKQARSLAGATMPDGTKHS